MISFDPREQSPVTAKEWEAARQFFHDNPDQVIFDGHKRSPEGVKLRDQTGNTRRAHHTFICQEGECFALAIGGHLGKGGEGIVKLGYAEDGTVIAVKKCYLSKGYEDNAGDVTILAYLNRLYAVIERTLDQGKVYRDRIVQRVRYIVQPYIKASPLGTNPYIHLLSKHLYALSTIQRIVIAYLCALEIQFLHEQNIVHGDISASNLLLTQSKKHIDITAIDFSFGALLVDEQQEDARKINSVNPRYAAPELCAPDARGDYVYSKASDVYALGKVFQNFLLLTEGIYLPLCHQEASKRPTIQSVLQTLKNVIEKSKSISAALKADLLNPDRSAQKPVLSMQGLLESRISALDYQLAQLKSKTKQAKLHFQKNLIAFMCEPCEQTWLNAMRTMPLAWHQKNPKKYQPHREVQALIQKWQVMLESAEPHLHRTLQRFQQAIAGGASRG